jgi:hypothetical protein
MKRSRTSLPEWPPNERGSVLECAREAPLSPNPTTAPQPVAPVCKPPPTPPQLPRFRIADPRLSHYPESQSDRWPSHERGSVLECAREAPLSTNPTRSPQPVAPICKPPPPPTPFPYFVPQRFCLKFPPKPPVSGLGTFTFLLTHHPAEPGSVKYPPNPPRGFGMRPSASFTRYQICSNRLGFST